MSYFSSSPITIADSGKIKAVWQGLLPFMRIHKFRADGTITEGMCVKPDFSDIATAAGSTTGITTTAQVAALTGTTAVIRKVIATSTTAAGEPFIGVALHDAVAGEDILVCTGGFCPKVLFSGATDITAGQALVAASTAGACILYAAGTHTAHSEFGYAASSESDSDGFVAAFIKPQMP